MKKSKIFIFIFRKNIFLKAGFLAFTFLIFLFSCEKEDSEPLPQWYPETNENGDSVLGVFENKLPCSDCEKIKFALVLYKKNQSELPTTYTMARVYVSKNDDRLMNSGDVSIILGTSLDSLETVYQLDSNALHNISLK
jgi:hypothetical protein